MTDNITAVSATIKGDSMAVPEVLLYLLESHTPKGTDTISFYLTFRNRAFLACLPVPSHGQVSSAEHGLRFFMSSIKKKKI